MPFPDEIETLPTDQVDGLDAGDETAGSTEVGPHSQDHRNVNRIVNELQQLVLDLLAAPAPSGGGGGSPRLLPDNVIATLWPQHATYSGNSGANTLYGARAYAHKGGTLHNLWLPVNSCYVAGKLRGVVYSGAGQRLWLGNEIDTFDGMLDLAAGEGEYRWSSGDTANSGSFSYQFKILWPGTTTEPQTVPVDSYLDLLILDDLT